MRQQQYLKNRYQVLSGYLGELLILIGSLQLVPLLLLPFYPDEIVNAGGFLVAGIPVISLGFFLWKRQSPKESLSLTLQEGTVIIVIMWMVAIGISTIPFMTIIDLNFSQAIFESTSGWTTTGLSVVDVTTAPKLILFFRSFIQLAGGAGIAIIVSSIITGASGIGLAAAEGRTDQLSPHVRHSASIVLRIYGSYAVVGIVALKLAGMGWFDALNHSFTAIATGGFSTQVASIGHWDNALIEIIICILMILGSINFLTAYLLFQGRFESFRRNGEIRVATVLIIIGSLLMIPIVTLPLYDADKAIRIAFFEVVSSISGTGFTVTGDYHPWNEFGWLVLVILMSVGGGTGSTAGGIKQFRIYILFKAIVWEIRRAFMPQHMVNEPAIWQGDKRFLLNDRHVRQAAIFIVIYIALLMIGTGLLTAYGYPLKESLFEFASALGTVGLSIGITHPDMPVVLLWGQSIGMLLGRLEVFVVVIGLSKLALDAKMIFRPTKEN